MNTILSEIKVRVQSNLTQNVNDFGFIKLAFLGINLVRDFLTKQSEIDEGHFFTLSQPYFLEIFNHFFKICVLYC